MKRALLAVGMALAILVFLAVCLLVGVAMAMYVPWLPFLIVAVAISFAAWGMSGAWLSSPRGDEP